MPLILESYWCKCFSVVLSLIVIFVAYFKWSLNYWNRKGVLTPKTSIPFGNAAKTFFRQEALGENVASVYREFKSKGLKYCGYYFAIRPTWIPIDLDLIKTIMTKDFNYFMDHGNYINEKNDPLTGQLFMQVGTKWKNLRIKLTPTFTSGKMKMMFPTLLDCSGELITVMDQAAVEHTAVEIKDIIARFTTDIIGSCAFGLNCNSLKDPNSKFRIYGKRIFEGSGNRLFSLLKALALAICPAIIDILKIPVFPRDVTAFFLKLVRDTVDYREKNKIIRKDFMHLLIQLKNNVNVSNEETVGSLTEQGNKDSSTSLSIEEMTAQVFIFFLAGFETSSTTLTFCFYELSRNQELQDRVRREVVQVIEKYDGKLTYDALIDMTYMEMCINETLRKYPPLPVLLRECTTTYKVPQSDLIIKKGTRAFIPILGIQHNPEYYPDPDKFDPERFNPENKSKRHHFSWLPFGEGPRACIGLRFGMMQMKVALSILLKNYIFSVNEKTPSPLIMDPKSFIMNTKGGVWLNIEKI